ncbi:hypothetical protein ACHAXA_005186 [Cyclostephanos tholiformis]|uniref:AMMECR1 domain-containing protein n=1 Tax=Cyclostephanos tholiformis TaxID=382380 RepID=A0ABD3RTS9_9STRA
MATPRDGGISRATAPIEVRRSEEEEDGKFVRCPYVDDDVARRRRTTMEDDDDDGAEHRPRSSSQLQLRRRHNDNDDGRLDPIVVGGGMMGRGGGSSINGGGGRLPRSHAATAAASKSSREASSLIVMAMIYGRREKELPDGDNDEVKDDAYHRDDARCYDLRGCIGTLFPKSTLDVSLSEYAITSALYDRRFKPITVDELPYLRVCVSLLIGYKECATCHDWIVGVHGIIIEFVVSDAVATTGGTMYGTTGKGVRGGWTGGGTCTTYTATYLPEVAIEQGWDREEAVISLVRKSGYRGAVTSDLLSSIRCTRYRTSACHTSYREYCPRGRSGARRRMRRGRRALRRCGGGVVVDAKRRRDQGRDHDDERRRSLTYDAEQREFDRLVASELCRAADFYVHTLLVDVEHHLPSLGDGNNGCHVNERYNENDDDDVNVDGKDYASARSSLLEAVAFAITNAIALQQDRMTSSFPARVGDVARAWEGGKLAAGGGGRTTSSTTATTIRHSVTVDHLDWGWGVMVTPIAHLLLLLSTMLFAVEDDDDDDCE